MTKIKQKVAGIGPYFKTISDHLNNAQQSYIMIQNI